MGLRPHHRWKRRGDDEAHVERDAGDRLRARDQSRDEPHHEGLTEIVSGDQFTPTNFTDLKGSFTVSGNKMSGDFLGVQCGGKVTLTHESSPGQLTRSRVRCEGAGMLTPASNDADVLNRGTAAPPSLPSLGSESQLGFQPWRRLLPWVASAGVVISVVEEGFHVARVEILFLVL